MALLFRVIHAQGPTGGSYPRQETYTDTGGPAGLTPIGYEITGTIVTAVDTSTTTARKSKGFCDLTNQRSVGIVAEHNAAAANADTARFADTAKVFVLGGTGGGTVPAVTAAHFGAGVNTITLTWDAAAAGNIDIILVYGTSGQSCHVGHITSSATIGNTAPSPVTGLPGSPNILLGMTAGDLAFSSGGAATHAKYGYGFAGRLPSVTQACAALVWEDQASNTSVGNIDRSNRIVAALDSAAGVVTAGTSLEASFTSDGFDVTTRDAAVAIDMAYLAIVDGVRRAKAEAVLLPVGTLGAFSRTDPGFRPMALFLSAARQSTVDAILDTQGSVYSGFVVSNSQGSTTVFDRDNRTTSEAYSHHTATYCGAQVQALGAYTYRFAWTAFTATGWDGSVASAAAGGDQYVAYLAIEDFSELVVSETENIGDNVALAVGLAQSETENISDEHAFLVGLAQSETENISDEVVLIAFSISNSMVLVLSEDVSIEDEHDMYLGGVLVLEDTENLTEGAPVFTGTMVLSETLELHEAQNFSGQALLVISESVELSEFTAAYLGALLVLTDTETITDNVSFGRGLIPMHGTERGTTLQGGAVEGAVLSAYSERGTTQ